MCGPRLASTPWVVPGESFEISYAAHTSSCTFLLDADGICRRIVMASGSRRGPSSSAARCVGAQYVASLDSNAAGGLIEMPRVGSAMLFARVDGRGRVSLVRTGVVSHFEALSGRDPFAETSGVQTSAPDILRVTEPDEPIPSTDVDERPPHDFDDLEEDFEDFAGEDDEGGSTYDDGAVTQPIYALDDSDLEPEAGNDLSSTAEYGPDEAPTPRRVAVHHDEPPPSSHRAPAPRKTDPWHLLGPKDEPMAAAASSPLRRRR